MGNRQRQILAYLILSSILMSCGSERDPSVDASTTGCQPGVAQIQIYDGFMQRLCGCSEAGNTKIIPPNTLSCTAPKGTKFFFYMGSAQTQHQIASDANPPQFAGSAIYTPGMGALTHVVTLDVSGSYPFKDLIDQTLKGTLIIL